MKVLFVLSHWGSPVCGGQQWVTYNLLRYLPSDVECDAIGFGLPTIPGEGGIERVRVRGSFDRPRGVALALLQAGCSIAQRPPALAHFASPRLRQRLQQIVPEYDLVHYETMPMLQYRDGRRPSVLLAHDAYSMGYKRALASCASWAGWLAMWYRSRLMERYESREYGRATKVVVLSAVDRNYLQDRCHGADIRVLPLPVDPEFFNRREAQKSADVLLSGSFRAPGIADAALWYASMVHPAVRARAPGCRLCICGRDLDERLARRLSESPGVLVKGYVEDYKATLEASAVYVAPQVTGSGVKNRIVQAMAMGIPVVGTAIACEGISVQDGVNAMVVSGALAFAEAVVNLLTRPALSRKIGDGGMRVARRDHHAAAVGQQLHAIYEEALSSVRT